MAGIKTFRGRVVLVTGAAGGIGRATALAFAKRGAEIVATDVNADALAALAADVADLQVRCTTYVVNVADDDAMRELADDVAAGPGVPDVLVNNAGIGYLGPFLESPLDHWPRVLGVNVMGVVHGCYYFIPKMIAAGGPRRVVIVASSAANYPPPSTAAYSTSKFGVFGFAEVLKMELAATNVGVTTVCPGVINTAIVHDSGNNVSPAVTQAQRDRLSRYYVKRGADPESVGEDIVRAVEDGTDVLLTGPASKLFFYLRRMSLGLARRLTYATAPAVGYR